MFDLHCHLIPAIDDGPKTLTQGLDMARLACNDGITHAVITPHIIPGRYDNTLATIQAAFKDFSKEVSKAGIPLELAVAAEIRLDLVIMQMVESKTVPYLGRDGDMDILLLEFPHETIPPGAMEMVTWLLDRKIRPMIAHPERNGSVINRFSTLEPFVKKGCLLQITSGSLTGVFGGEPRTIARKLLQKGWVSIIASDAHNKSKRKPELEAARKVAKKIAGEQEAWKLVRDRPSAYTSHLFQKAGTK